MKRVHRYLESKFEKVTTFIMMILGNSITFILALVIVCFWLTGKQFFSQTLHQQIENIIVAVTFLTLFTIQKEFKRFSASLHIKLNELISSNETANNKIMVVEEQTESELQVLTKMYAETALIETETAVIEEKLEEIKDSL
jgi:low affinity Fe/Cu permease